MSLRDKSSSSGTTDIRGAKVFGADNEKLGVVEDVLLDSSQSSGRGYAIVDSGGWLTSRRFLVPIESLQSASGDPNTYYASLTQDQVRQLPEFSDGILQSDDRFRDYESRYRSKWNTFGFRRSGIGNRVETYEAVPVASSSASSGTGVGRAVAVYGIYHNQDKLESAVDRLKSAGFSNEDISVVFPDKGRTDRFAMEKNTKAPEGATAGGGTGLVVGGVLGWLAGIGTLAIPGIGPLLAAGPIVAALAGAGVGGAVGGLAGALIGMGMPEIEAKRYEKEIKEGRMLLSVRCADSRYTGSAGSILAETDARDVFESGNLKAA